MMKKPLLILSSFLLSTSVFAQIGTFDPTFNDGNPYQIQNYISSAKIVSMSNETALNISNYGIPGSPGFAGEEHALIGLLTNNVAAASASAQGIVNPGFPEQHTGFNDYVIDANGKIVVVGYKQYDELSYASIFVGRYNANGTFDTGFNSGSFQEFDYSTSNMHSEVSKVLQLSSGKIMCIGKRASNTNLLIRINADGSIDNTYGTNGIYTWNFMGGGYSKIHDAIELNNGKLLLAGSEYDASNNNIQTSFVVRLNADGSIDNSFGTNGLVKILLGQPDKASYINSIALTSTGEIVAAGMGNFTGSSWDVSRGVVVKLNADGSINTNFGTYTEASDYSGFYKVLVTTNDQIIVAGNTSVSNSASSIFVFLNLDGTINANVDLDGKINNSAFPNAVIRDFTIQPDGKLIYVFQSYVSNMQNNMYVGRLLMSETTNSITENSQQIVEVYPNPSKGKSTIVVAKPTQIRVMSLDGVELLNTEIAVKKEIDLSAFASGIYFIHNAEGQIFKLIKE